MRNSNSIGKLANNERKSRATALWEFLALGGFCQSVLDLFLVHSSIHLALEPGHTQYRPQFAYRSSNPATFTGKLIAAAVLRIHRITPLLASINRTPSTQYVSSLPKNIQHRSIEGNRLTLNFFAVFSRSDPTQALIMASVVVTGVKLLENPSMFHDVFKFEITFECITPLQHGMPLSRLCISLLFIPPSLDAKILLRNLIVANRPRKTAAGL